MQIILFRRWNFSFWNQPIADVLSALKMLFYERKLTELKQEIEELSQKLVRDDLENKHGILNKASASHSAVSNSLQLHGLYSPPGSSVHGIFQVRVLE